MSEPDCDTLILPGGFLSREAALFVAQLDDLDRRLHANTRDLTADDLAWQSDRGMNTMGMLLAHIAIVEVYWADLGPAGKQICDCAAVLGIGLDDDGLPLPADGAPPEVLAGKDVAFFDDLRTRARAHTYAVTARLTDADLDRVVRRTRKSGVVEREDVRWILYHVVEHTAGHYGQILMLRHLRRARAGR